MKKRLIIVAFIIGLMITGCSKERNEKLTLTISAAISLTEALEEIKEIYEQDSDLSLSFNFAGSGTLAQQIQQGAPVDLFISANSDWMDFLEEEGLISKGSREIVVKNQLVIIGQKDTKIEGFDFASANFNSFPTIALGNPDSVPAGKYAEEALRSLNKWTSLEERIVFAKDVRQVLTYVGTGNADLGFVYKSDALSEDKVKILAKIDDNYHEPIVYPGAVISGGQFEKEAQDFLRFLLLEEAQSIFGKYGFH